MEGPNVDCPQCGDQLDETDDPQTYECQRCGTELRQVVVESLDSFKRVAERGGPAADIAHAALGGNPEE